MGGEVPNASFRLEHSFSVKPDLTVDESPDRGLLMGRVGRGEFEAVYLGKHAETGFRNAWLDTRGAHVLYVMGKRRSGKSFTLGVLAEGLVADSWIRQGSLPQGVLLLDTMNVYLTLPFSLLGTLPASSDEVKEFKRWKLDDEQPRVVLLRPAGTGSPPDVASSELTLRPSDLGSEEWCGIFEADPFADPLGHLITEVYGKVALDGYVDEHGASVPSNPLFSIDDLLRALEQDADLQRYHRDTREALRRRFHAIRRLPIFSDRGLNVTELLRPGQVTVLLLRDLDQQLRAALVALIVKQVIQLRGLSEQEERLEAVHRQRAAKLTEENDAVEAARESQLADQCHARAAEGLPRSWLLIDEAHNYVPATGVTPSRKPLKKYVDEGRNLGLSIVVATQNPAGLDPSIQRNADVLLIHALSRHDDIAAAEGMINTAPPNEVTLDSRHKFEGARALENLVRALPLGYALAATDRANRLFPIRMRPRITLPGGADY
ncbi:MAG: ATP-binding protein [Actinomycetota bacterium]